MRKIFNQQMTLGIKAIEEIKIPINKRDHMANLLSALQYIYVTPKWNKTVYKLLEEKIQSKKINIERPGMSL